MAALSEKLKLAGVVGAGGAGFPTYVKAAAQVEFMIANLPVGSGDLRPRPAALGDASGDIGAGSVALVVEDEQALGTAVAEALGDAGFQVDRAADGEEALDRVRARPYDLIICDLKMPRLDGTAFYRTLAVTYPALARRIVFVTGDTLTPESTRFLTRAGAPTVTKPLTPEDIHRVTQHVLRTA